MAEKYQGHTPGPWYVDPASPLFVMGSGADGRIGYCYAAYADRTAEEGHANARLIAAAPELLAALEEALVQLNAFARIDHARADRAGQMRDAGIDRAIRSASAAIAKAKGDGQ